MGLTLTTNIGAGVNRKYDKKFLRQITYDLRLAPLGQKRPLDSGSGLIIEFFKYNELALTLTTGVMDHVLATQSTTPTSVAITGTSKTATIKEYGIWSELGALLKKTHIDQNLAGVSKLFGEHAARTIELECMQKCSSGFTAVRADLDATYQFSGSITTATSTTVFNDTKIASNTGYGDANDDLNQSVIVFTSGNNKGEARAVTDYATAGGVITVSPALPNATVIGDQYYVCAPNGLLPTTASNADSLNSAAVARAVRILRTYSAAPLDGGFYAGVIPPEAEEGLTKDSNWINVQLYKDSVNGLFSGEIGKLFGVRFIRGNNGFRFPTEADGTAGTGGGPGVGGINYHPLYALGASETAIISSSWIVGEEAFGVTKFTDEMGNLVPKLIIKNANLEDRSNTGDPLNLKSTIGYYLPFVAHPLQALFGVQVWSAEKRL